MDDDKSLDFHVTFLARPLGGPEKRKTIRNPNPLIANLTGDSPSRKIFVLRPSKSLTRRAPCIGRL